MASSAECSILPALHQRSVNRVGKAKNNNRFKWEAANVTSKCVFDCVWVPLCMEMPPAEQFHITCFMHGSPTGTYIQRKRSKHVLPCISAERRLADCGLHAWLPQTCSQWLEQMVEGPVAMASLLWHQYSQRKLKAKRGKGKKKRHKPDGCCHPLQ